MTTSYQFTPIAIVHSPFKEKFGTPRQPGLVRQTRFSLELLPPYDRIEALDGLEQFSHLWLIFVFHQNREKLWSAKIRPPRLGGNQRIGVFATRAPYRPNPLGLSVVELDAIREENNKIFIDINGADLVEGTPVLDIKPYIPYADSIEDARAGFAEDKPGAALAVEFTQQALAQIAEARATYPQLQQIIQEVLALDPRPAYSEEKGTNKQYGMKLLDFDVQWQVDNGVARVIALHNE